MDTGGTQFDPGAVANTKGAWAELDPSIANEIRMMMIALGQNDLTATSKAFYLVDIGVGAAGSEQVIIADYPVARDSSGDRPQPQLTPPIPVNIPAGSRLAVRAQCSLTTPNNRELEMIVYGVD